KPGYQARSQCNAGNADSVTTFSPYEGGTMINLLALTLSVNLMTGAVIDAGFISAQDSRRRERDEDSGRKRASELLLKASRIEIEFIGGRFFPSSILLGQMRLTRDPEEPDHKEPGAPLSLRIGNISVKGAKLLTPERVIEISGLRTGEII